MPMFARRFEIGKLGGHWDRNFKIIAPLQTANRSIRFGRCKEI